MTIHYLHGVRSSGLGVFVKLLFKWRGGIAQLIFTELLIYISTFYLIRTVYLLGMNEAWQQGFSHIVDATQTFKNKIPVSIILGFYIAAVYMNFIRRFMQIPWIMNASTQLAFILHGNNNGEKQYRNSILRYLNVALIITIMRIHKHEVMVDLSVLVKKDMLTAKELEMIQSTQFLQIQPFIPICWSLNLLKKAREKEIISNIHGYIQLVEDINAYRQCLLDMLIHDQISFPLIYTQLNTVLVYAYFLLALFGSQATKYHFPVGTVMEFIVFMGMLKCAVGMLNPMGNNDENFEINEIIVYNWKVAHYITKTAINHMPKRVEKDINYNKKTIDIDISPFRKSHAILNG